MNFEDLAFLFTCDNRNRGVIRMNFDEAACLWRFVKGTSGDVLEIGRRHGGSTILLLAAAGESRRVISIDIDPAHHPDADAFFAKPTVAGRLDLVVADSRKYRTPPIGIMFVDGDHSYDGTAADVSAHWAQLSLDGLAVFHDAVPNLGLAHNNEINHCPGVTSVCNKLTRAGIAEEVETAGSILVVRKRTELPSPSFFHHTEPSDVGA